MRCRRVDSQEGMLVRHIVMVSVLIRSWEGSRRLLGIVPFVMRQPAHMSCVEMTAHLLAISAQCPPHWLASWERGKQANVLRL